MSENNGWKGFKHDVAQIFHKNVLPDTPRPESERDRLGATKQSSKMPFELSAFFMIVLMVSWGESHSLLRDTNPYRWVIALGSTTRRAAAEC
jgi:hypothetical protein